MKRNFQRGFSVVEVLVAAVVTSVSMYAIISGYTQYMKLVGVLSTKKAEYFSIANIRESIMASPEHYQFAAGEGLAEPKLEPGALPWYSNSDALVSRATCEASNSCAQYGFKVGYVLYPHPSGVSRSLYTLHIRIYDQKNQFSTDFKYLVAIR